MEKSPGQGHCWGHPSSGVSRPWGGDRKVPVCTVTPCLSPLQGEGGPRGERGEPGEKGRDGAPVSAALSPRLVLTPGPAWC